MAELAGLTRTGRVVSGPAADAVELEAPNGLKHLALVHLPELRNDPALTGPLGVRGPFLADPEVGGLARLVKVVPEEGAFLYPTGTVWTLAEVVRALTEKWPVSPRRDPKVEGARTRAGLELCYMAGEILGEAADLGSRHGVSGHGSLHPSRLTLKSDGQVTLIGYGLPAVDALAWRAGRYKAAKEETFRYSPPERLGGRPEDGSSDLFVLTLLALELMTGRPVYDGLLEDVRQQATRGEALRFLYQWREVLPESIRDVLGRALKPDPDTRWRDPVDFVYAVHDLLNGVEADGPNLVEVMNRVRDESRRPSSLPAGATTLMTPDQLAALVADPEDAARPLPPPRRAKEVEVQVEPAGPAPRWGQVQRPGRAPEPTAPVAAPAEAPPARSAGLRDRLRTRGGEGGAAPVPPPAPPPPSADAGRDLLKQRLRQRGGLPGGGESPRGAEPAPPVEPPVAAAPGPSPAPSPANPPPRPTPAPPRPAPPAAGPSTPPPPAATPARVAPVAVVEEPKPAPEPERPAVSPKPPEPAPAPQTSAEAPKSSAAELLARLRRSLRPPEPGPASPPEVEVPPPQAPPPVASTAPAAPTPPAAPVLRWSDGPRSGELQASWTLAEAPSRSGLMPRLDLQGQVLEWPSLLAEGGDPDSTLADHPPGTWTVSWRPCRWLSLRLNLGALGWIDLKVPDALQGQEVLAGLSRLFAGRTFSTLRLEGRVVSSLGRLGDWVNAAAANGEVDP